MINNGIDYDFDMIDMVNEPKDAEIVHQSNPINKIPVLFVNDKPIYDSRVILNYLIRSYDLKPLSIEDENNMSVVYSCIDAGVTLFLMSRAGYDMNQSSFFLNRMKARIPDGLDHLKPWMKTLNPENSDHWNIPCMSLYSFLYWGEARELLSLNDWPEYKDFLNQWQNAKGIKETSF